MTDGLDIIKWSLSTDNRITVSFDNGSAVAENSLFYAASYDDNGKMLSVDVLTESGQSTRTLTSSTAKLFWLDKNVVSRSAAAAICLPGPG